MDVLVGIEGSDESRLALDRTIDRAKEADDDLTVAVFAKEGQSIDDVEAWVEDELATAGLDAEIIRLETDHPASKLIELAEADEFDQLVIGGGQRSPMGKIELGSITEFIMLNAQVTVRLER